MFRCFQLIIVFLRCRYFHAEYFLLLMPQDDAERATRFYFVLPASRPHTMLYGALMMPSLLPSC